MEWEVELIEWLQTYIIDACKVLGSFFSFADAEKGILVFLAVVLLRYILDSIHCSRSHSIRNSLKALLWLSF